MKSGVVLSKRARVGSGKGAKTPARMKSKKTVTPDDSSDLPSLVAILDGGSVSTCTVEPRGPSDPPGQSGTVVLVPNEEDYFFALAYISDEEPKSVTVALPSVQNILVMYLPKGMFTPPADIEETIGGSHSGPPDSVGPSGSNS